MRNQQMSFKSVKKRFKLRRKKLKAKIRQSLYDLTQRPKGLKKLKSANQEPIIIIMVDGGFCSVMTKYLLGKCLQSRFNMTVKYDLTWFEENGKDCDNNLSRSFQLFDAFPDIDFPIATKEEIELYKTYFRYNNVSPYLFNESLFTHKRPLYVDGYCEHWEYFDMVKEDILKDFAFDNLPLNKQNQELLHDIQAKEKSVAVHVRRGDYVNLGLCTLTPEYYISAIKMLHQELGANTHFYFFSDGLDWVKEVIISKLDANTDYTCVDANDNDAGYFDLNLISKCDHQISSNSSFGYWGGLLNTNPDKIVILPDFWVPNPEFNIQLEGSEMAHRFPESRTLSYLGEK